MKKSILKYTLIVLSTLLITSCSSDDDSLDTTKPEIQLISPKDDAHFHLGDEISIEAILKDNTALGSVKIDIHSAKDGHQHKTANISWEYNEEINISGNTKEFALSHKVQIPAEGITGGHYHLGLYVIDQVGNQTQQFIEIEVVNHHEDDDHDHDHDH